MKIHLTSLPENPVAFRMAILSIFSKIIIFRVYCKCQILQQSKGYDTNRIRNNASNRTSRFKLRIGGLVINGIGKSNLFLKFFGHSRCRSNMSLQFDLYVGDIIGGNFSQQFLCGSQRSITLHHLINILQCRLEKYPQFSSAAKFAFG